MGPNWILERAEDRIEDFNEFLRQELKMPGFYVDNAAVLFYNLGRMEEFLRDCVEDGMEHYRSEDDFIISPIKQESYSVRFEFLRYPGGLRNELPFRVEAMVITGGFSRIHEDALKESEEGHCIQVSMKCLNLRQMEMLRENFRQHGMTQEEFFIGEYGPYDYWKVHESKTFLKTRVNMRD